VPVRTIACWVPTRLLLAAAVLGLVPYRWPQTIRGDLRLYEGWAEVVRQGHFPADDWNWQYPPGAAVAILLPDLLPGGYLVGFLAVAVLADAAVLAVLLRLGRGSRWAAWYWVAAVPLLGPIAYARYDLVVAALAVAALAVAGRPLAAGALSGVGAMLKVWPVLLLLGLPRGAAARRAAGGAVAGAAVLAAVLVVLLPGSLGFLAYQRDRGVQIESVPGTVFLLGRHLGWPGTNDFRYGAREFLGPGVGAVRAVALLATVAALGWLPWWWWRARWRPSVPYDAALAATLLAVVTSRVLSPQYLIWLAALGAVCLTRPDTVQRPAALLVLGCTALTQLEFPVLWDWVVHARLPLDLVLAARNAGLVCAAVLSVRALLRSTAPLPPSPLNPLPAADRTVSDR
jgi:hypothetical protein